jgi:nucleotide-binding universal stress UspA family protein
MIHKILVAYDGFEASERAFELGRELAERFQAKLYVLAIVRLSEPTTSLELGAILDGARQQYEQKFEVLRARCMASKVELSTAVEVGHPAEHIVAMAEREGCDLVVLGRHSRTALGRLMLGSTSERVLHYAHCAVTIVR